MLGVSMQSVFKAECRYECPTALSIRELSITVLSMITLRIKHRYAYVTLLYCYDECH
jgi:hypothetical protein